jgi:hypothetical protein
MSDEIPEEREMRSRMSPQDLAAIERIVREATRSWREAIARGDFKPVR